MNFNKRIEKPEKRNIFEMDGYFIWCGSVVMDDDGIYNMFASRWKKEHDFRGWLTHSSIVRAVSKNPDGPFEFVEELTQLKEQNWCSKMVHNPTVSKIGDKFYLYYVGTTYTDEEHKNTPKFEGSSHPGRFNQQIGVAVADKASGPWVPSVNNPVLSPRAGKWDSTFVTNPSVYMVENKIHMIYKAKWPDDYRLMLGLATAENPEGPFSRLDYSRLFDYDIEDPFVWFENGKYYMVAKDMSGELVGHSAVALFESDNAKDFKISENPLAWDLTIDWADDEKETVAHIERPQILIQNGKPVCLYNAVGDFNNKHSGTYSYNLARKIKV